MYENISKCQDVVIIQQKIYKFFRVATKFCWMKSLTFALNTVFFPLLKPWQLYVFSLTYSKKHSFFSDFLCWSTCPNLTSRILWQRTISNDNDLINIIVVTSLIIFWKNFLIQLKAKLSPTKQNNTNNEDKKAVNTCDLSLSLSLFLR